MNRISFLNRGYAFKGLLAVAWAQQCVQPHQNDAELIKFDNDWSAGLKGL